jgi:simple sugar transport system ATP-binding protein
MVQPGGTALRLRGISKAFGPLQALKDVDIDVSWGEVAIILGENGAGKSTLVSVVFGEYVADSGTVEVAGAPLPKGNPAAALEAGVGVVHQHFTLADNLNVLDNIVLGTEPLFAPVRRTRRALERLGAISEQYGLKVDPRALVRDLSVGERQRVEILKALYRDARILILDEPTAVLTPAEASRLIQTIRLLVADGRAVIFISHKLEEVLAVGDRVIVLRDGAIAGETRAGEATASQLATMMIGRTVAEPERQRREPGPVIVELEAVNVHDPNPARGLIDVSFSVSAGQILGITGIAGNGQQALAEFVCGLRPALAGRYRLDGTDVAGRGVRWLLKNGVRKIAADRHADAVFGDLDLSRTIISEDYARAPFSRHGIMNWQAVQVFSDEIIRHYDVRCSSAAVPARVLSGGNLQKLLLGRALEQSPRFLVANQPTRGLDVGATAYVHGRILAARDAGTAVLLITEDMDELLRLSDMVAVMFRGHLSAVTEREAQTLESLGVKMGGSATETSHAV